MAKKSLYIFLCAILGMLLFLILHQIVAFAYLMLLYTHYSIFNLGLSFMDLMALDYFSLIIALMFGAWYGIWLGLYWYGWVYESGGHGFVEHMIKKHWAAKSVTYNLKSKLVAVESKLQEPAPKKRIVRRKV